MRYDALLNAAQAHPFQGLAGEAGGLKEAKGLPITKDRHALKGRP
jgi:hypothetical protein